MRCGRCGHLFDVLENLSESQPEPAIGGELSDSEAPSAIVDEGQEQDSSESSAALGDLPVSTLDRSNFAARLLDDIDLEDVSRDKKNLGRQLGLVLIIVVVAVISLGGQFVFFKLPTLSQQFAYRPWLQRFCTLLPCELEAYSEYRLINIEHLQVRSHPDLEGILWIELVLINRASFEQAYPPLLLRFNDLSGELVATRRFSGEEYLPRALSGGRLMPVDKAVGIKLAIVDPGERALSYSVTIGE